MRNQDFVLVSTYCFKPKKQKNGTYVSSLKLEAGNLQDYINSFIYRKKNEESYVGVWALGRQNRDCLQRVVSARARGSHALESRHLETHCSLPLIAYNPRPFIDFDHFLLQILL